MYSPARSGPPADAKSGRKLGRRRASRAIPAALLSGAAVVLMAPDAALAFCNSSIESYTISQCPQGGYFQPVPFPFTPLDVSGQFWQLGFGNATVNTGLGADGTGFASGVFNGNDSGIFPVDVLDADATFPGEGFPPGSTCLGSNDWANTGVDGCCDNSRPLGNPGWDLTPGYFNVYSGYGPYLYASNDNILNPYFGTFQASQGFPGYFSIGSITDYPTAVLLKLPGDAWFAVAAVTNMDRGNNFAPEDSSTFTGPCNAIQPGTNPAACDQRQGFFSLADITTGLPNAIPSQAGRNNVIPWQQPPAPQFDPFTDLSPDPNDPLRSIVDFSWPQVFFHSDSRSVPSNNPTLDARNPSQPHDPDAAPGAGVVDILDTFGLVRYQIDVLFVPFPYDPNDPGFVARTVVCPGDPACTSETSASLNVSRDEWLRIRTIFGTRPRVTTPSLADCRLGRCGDTGYAVTGPRLLVDPCVQGAFSEECNGLDDDGDGYTDECLGAVTGDPCEGQGECGAGIFQCHWDNPYNVICSTDPGGFDDQSAPEVCDHLDNDCDGSTDEDFAPPTTPGDGMDLDPNGVLTWSAASGAETYNLYRGGITPSGFAYTHTCLQAGIVPLTATDTDTPAPDEAYYYLLSSENCLAESGVDDAGSGVRPLTSCP